MRARRHDVVVVGAGPAGLAAAVAAAERGRSVLVLDQAPHPGGQVWRPAAGEAVPPPAARLVARLRAAGGGMVQGSVVDADGPGTLVVDFGGRVDRVAAGALVLATGAVERFLPFPGWTLPGVTGVGGLQALLKGGLPLRGRRVVLAGTGPLLYPVAAAVVRAGADLACVLEQAPLGAVVRFGARALLDPARFAAALRYRLATARVAWHHGAMVLRAAGDDRLAEVTIRTRGGERTLAADWLGAAAGLVPRTEVGRLLGCALAGEALAVDGTQATSVAGVWAAGECTGVKGDAAGVVEGTIAGAAAAGDPAPARALAAARAGGVAFGARLARTFAPSPPLLARAAPDTILCRCEDVRMAAVAPGWGAREAKLQCRVGMGACQGAVCGAAGTVLFGWEPPLVRPPLGAPPLGAWAAHLTPPEPPAA